MHFVIDDEGVLNRIYLELNETEVIVPSGVKKIGNSVFSYLTNLRKVEIPDTVVSIGERAFNGCGVENIVLPNSIISIENNAFGRCKNLKSIDLPNSLEYIGDSAFFGCSSLEKIEIPSLIKEINPETFFSCTNLKKIVLPDDLEYIGHSAFFVCTSLEKIIIPNSVKIIEQDAFTSCKNLQTVVLSDSLEEISPKVFYKCGNLKKIVLPPSLKIIGMKAFGDCSNLKEVILSPNLEEIGTYAFSRCINLEKIEIPKAIEKVRLGAFVFCNSLKEIKLGKFTDVILPGIKDKYDYNLLKDFNYYINEKTQELLMLKNNGFLENYKKIDNKWCENNFECNIFTSIVLSIMFSEEELKKMGDLQYVLNGIVRDIITIDNYKQISKDFLNNKEYRRVLKKISNLESEIFPNNSLLQNDMFRLAYSLGAFSDNNIDRQRACEFLINALDKGKLIYDSTFHSMFESLKFCEFSKEWAEFLMNKNNFDKLLELEKEESGLISRICNSFNKIREFGRSNRGDQHYKKVTIEMCKKYFAEASFEGINENNKDIAKEISKYTREQESFDKASEIREKYMELKESGKINDHILKEELKEVFDCINREKINILNNSKEILDDLNEIANQRFSYEFLAKCDPRNFTLGKYCCCCAHLEGVGSGIMEASILHPDCQNLVIKDSKGKIIAKSTLYINRSQGYGVFNNVEINNNLSEDDKKLIYKKYMKAIDDFATRYNEINKDKPINQINVGMNLNDLGREIRNNNVETDEILRGIDFSKYGTYGGDWQKEQYVLWKKETKSKR